MKNLLLLSITYYAFSVSIKAEDHSGKKPLETQACFKRKDPLEVAANKEKWKYFEAFSGDQRDIIVKNWTQYFADDIYEKLDSKPENVFPIKVDSYGSMYPHPDVLKDIDYTTWKRGDNNLDEYSILQYFRINKDQIRSNISTAALPESEKSLYQDLLKLDDYDSMDLFYKKWDELHFKKQLNLLNEKIRTGGYSEVVFFIHGYNVPYSLAVVQLISLKGVLDNLGKNKNRIKRLYVPIFWSSKANKYHEISSKEKFDISNHTRPFKGGLSTGRSFLFYSNRAYYAAITLRKLINRIDSNVSVSLISHSLGATIATTALINTYSKLHTSEFINDSSRDDGTDTILSWIENNLTRDIVKSLAMEPIPSRPVKVFLSAPAIPGMNTFKDINRAFIGNKQFYACLNLTDEMLTKNISRKLIFVNRFNMSSTSLGCDINELRRVKDTVEARSEAKFIFEEVSQHWDHDLLTYFQQPAFLNFLEAFIDEEAVPKDSMDALKASFKKEYEKLLISIGEDPGRHTLAIRKDLNVIKMSFRSRRNINTIAAPLKGILFAVEAFTYHGKDISADTRELINSMKDPYAIVLLERAIKEDETFDDVYFKEKLMSAVSDKLNLEMKYRYPYYSYETRNKKPMKFLSVNVGNDLFQLFKPNLDRDYTGSLLVELASDYLNTTRRRPLKTYQVFQYGFEVYTPAFYDTSKFKKFDSFDPEDRPHGSFQFFGWAKKGLSKYNNLRWTVGFKVGVIGGRIGYLFQTVLHQDISYSLRPRGWDAQIAKGGRLGLSLETKHEWQFAKTPGRDNSIKKWYFVLSPEGKIGTFMTTLGAGFHIRNKSFAQSNHNYITHRIKQSHVSFYDHLLIDLGIDYTYVRHNTMLEGYGIWNNKEWRDDSLAPKSVHKLVDDQVNRNLWNLNFTLSYTVRYATFFYNFIMYSPETRLGKITFKRDEETVHINLSTRWHYFGRVGMTFNIQ